MKKIKIRFVGRCKKIHSEPNDYLIQEKKWWGWKYLTYYQFGGFGDCIGTLYCNNDKETLYKDVLENYYKVGGKFVQTEEYPMILK